MNDTKPLLHDVESGATHAEAQRSRRLPTEIVLAGLLSLVHAVIAGIHYNSSWNGSGVDAVIIAFTTFFMVMLISLALFFQPNRQLILALRLYCVVAFIAFPVFWIREVVLLFQIQHSAAPTHTLSWAALACGALALLQL
eukprot:NODE_5647_length_685_cov_74.969534_g5624_i0.p1 GENE.NODE_5647_length_685_cov_74.969534_g5624_i0~~NODE_5647_length_685_cov_74.969534_g5624_i0.p1  ORF type:complete len:140 (+),score=16.63 NODE_5647_length_685_cov_74.969534_g5624_i0:126-545(+)